MKLGAITNSWREHLARESIEALVDRAAERGAAHVELRQTCLGDCETGEGDGWRPNIEGLKALVAQHPDMSFNLAVAYPCLSEDAQPKSALFQSMLDAAVAVSPDAPHLRMVDPARFDALWETPADIPGSAMSISALVQEAAGRGVTLSMENSGQPIRSLAMLVQAVRDALPDGEGSILGLCPDPTNQLRIDAGSDPVGEVEALPVDMIKTIHFKQTRGGEAIPTVDSGDVDCLRQLKALQDKGYAGPAIMEIPPHEDVFENLSASFDFLRG